MSVVMGQFQTHAVQQSTSLLDHLVGAGEQFCGHFDAQRFRCFHVDRELELCWQFERQIARLDTLKYLLHKNGSVSEAISFVDTIADEAASTITA